jgi:prephenate dehydrogenase
MSAAKPKVAIIGVGLLGGSLALALKKKGGFRLVGWNHRPSSRRKAAKILPVVSTFEEAVRGAEIVVLCSHSGSIKPVLTQLRSSMGPKTLVMDVSSVKGKVVEDARKIPGMNGHFVPCHPMAGKEKSGPGYADARLYEGRYVFITPLPKTSSDLLNRAKLFWKKAGAIPVVTDAGNHDRSVALTSHLPHLLASTLMNLFKAHQGGRAVMRQAIGSGFRDFTRIAGGNPSMWADILEMNSREIKHYLSAYRGVLAELERKLGKGRRSFWLSFFEKARASREKL